MSPEALFSHASTAAMVGWTLLILGPRRFAWVNAIPLWLLPMALSVVYSLVVLSRFEGIGGGFDSLASVATLVASDWGLLAGWVHFLAFDLFVGAVMALRMDRAGVSRVVQAPVLFAIFMFGPFGFFIAALTELGLRAAPLLNRIAQKGPRHVAA